MIIKMKNLKYGSITWMLFMLQLIKLVGCRGTNFKIVFFKHNSNTAELIFIVINNTPETANVTIDSNRFSESTRSNLLISSNGGFHKQNLTSQLLLSDTSDADKHVICIQSNVDVTVVTQNSRSYAFDAYMAIPVTYAAAEFYVTPYCSETVSEPSQCVVGILAVYSNTEVTFVMPDNMVTLTSGDIGGKTEFHAAETLSDLIYFGEVKYLQGNNFIGMKISSNNSVHVFVGNTMGTFYTGSNNDFTEEQLMPVSKWGLSYLVAKSSITDERIWIITSKADTKIKIVSNSSSCKQYIITSAGEFLDLVVSEDVSYIIANKPVGVTHFVLRTKGLLYTMYCVTPLEQFDTEAVAFVPKSSGTGDAEIKFAAAVVFTNTNMTSSLVFDGTALSSSTEWKEIPYSGMSVTTVQLTIKQTHTFQQREFGGTLGGYVFGYDSYAIFAHALTVSYRNLKTDCDGPCYDSNIYNSVNCSNVSSTTAISAECTTLPLVANSTTTNGFYCICSECRDENNSTGKIEQDFQRMINEMSVESTETSKYRRRKTSADDKRASSKAIGAIFSFISVGIFGMLIYLDVKQVFTFVQKCYKTFSQQNCTDRATAGNED